MARTPKVLSIARGEETTVELDFDGVVYAVTLEVGGEVYGVAGDGCALMPDEVPECVLVFAHFAQYK